MKVVHSEILAVVYELELRNVTCMTLNSLDCSTEM